MTQQEFLHKALVAKLIYFEPIERPSRVQSAFFFWKDPARGVVFNHGFSPTDEEKYKSWIKTQFIFWNRKFKELK